MAWARNGTPNTLSATADDIDITDLTAKKFNVFLAHTFRTSGSSANLLHNYTFDDNGNTDYAYRRQSLGAADTTATSVAAHMPGQQNELFEVGYVVNIDGEEKLGIMQGTGLSTAGSGTAPEDRVETVFKCDTSTNTGQFTRVDLRNSLAGSDFDTGSNFSVLTGDETETATLQNGTIFEETDTNKAYIWNATTKTWTQL